METKEKRKGGKEENTGVSEGRSDGKSKNKNKAREKFSTQTQGAKKGQKMGLLVWIHHASAECYCISSSHPQTPQTQAHINLKATNLVFKGRG